MEGVDELDWDIQKYNLRLKFENAYLSSFTNAVDVAINSAYFI